MNNSDKFNRLVRARYGFVLYNQHDRYIGRSIELYGEYSQAEVHVFQQLCKSGDVVVEVGANIGVHTLPLAKCVGDNGHVYAFEPQRIVFQTLCANVALNSLTNVTCFPQGVAKIPTTIGICEANSRQSTNFGGLSIANLRPNQKRPTSSKPTGSNAALELVTLDSVIPTGPVNLLKIDVEGMELEVLKGSERIIKQQAPIIYVENDRQGNSKELIEYLWSLHYDLFWFLPPLYNENNFYKNKSNVFNDIVSVNMLCVPKKSDKQVKDMEKVVDSTHHPLRPAFI